MLDKYAILKVCDELRPEHFHAHIHQIIYQAIIQLFQEDIAVDIITLSERLNKMKKLDEIGGTYYLTEINTKTPTAANIYFHAFLKLMCYNFNL